MEDKKRKRSDDIEANPQTKRPNVSKSPLKINVSSKSPLSPNVSKSPLRPKPTLIVKPASLASEFIGKSGFIGKSMRMTSSQISVKSEFTDESIPQEELTKSFIQMEIRSLVKKRPVATSEANNSNTGNGVNFKRYLYF